MAVGLQASHQWAPLSGGACPAPSQPPGGVARPLPHTSQVRQGLNDPRGSWTDLSAVEGRLSGGTQMPGPRVALRRPARMLRRDLHCPREAIRQEGSAGHLFSLIEGTHSLLEVVLVCLFFMRNLRQLGRARRNSR